MLLLPGEGSHFLNKEYRGWAGRFYILGHGDSSGPPPLLKNECPLSTCKYFKDPKLHFLLVFEKFTRVYLFQIALEIM